MDSICRDIFRAIYENKWLSIEYKNKQEEITRYWIGIIDVNPRNRSLQVEGLHLGQFSTATLTIYIDSILSSNLIEGSFFDVKISLKDDIELNSNKYVSLFHNIPNLKILNYYIDCNKLDSVPYKTEYSLIQHFDGDSLQNGDYYLSSEQFQEIVKNFQYENTKFTNRRKIKQFNRCLKPAKEITICTEFTINKTQESIRKFLDADDYELLKDFEKNLELIKDRITKTNGRITDMFHGDKVTIPIQAFFGKSESCVG